MLQSNLEIITDLCRLLTSCDWSCDWDWPGNNPVACWSQTCIGEWNDGLISFVRFFKITISLSLCCECFWLGFMYCLLSSPVLLFLFCFPSVTLPIILSRSLLLSLSVSAAFHHPSPARTNIHPPPRLPLCSQSPSLLPSLPLFLTISSSFSVAVLSLFLIHSLVPLLSLWLAFPLFTSFPLSPLQTPQPCRHLQGWTTRWSEVWWLLSSSSCSASSSSSADTSSDTKVICSHVRTRGWSRSCTHQGRTSHLQSKRRGPQEWKCLNMNYKHRFHFWSEWMPMRECLFIVC